MVLIVEDNEPNLKLTRHLLEHHGFETLEARDGQSGLAMAVSHRPHIVLLDIELPDIDGREVLRLLRAEPEMSGVPVIAVTAYAMEGDREAFLAAGFDGYITKPINVRTFADQVRSHCHPVVT